ncbi:MAG: class I SAM-dependent methyltransferase, partial [Acidobacteria bacterium]|nr:class I SAM-dependent methyltransferase [Acidobacteriota bacterium]
MTWANDELWQWLRRQDPERVTEAQWLVPILREWIYANKHNTLFGECKLEELDNDFWNWFRARLTSGAAKLEWYPPAVEEHYAQRQWQDFLAKKRDMTQPPHRIFYDVEEDLWFWMLTEGCRRHPTLQGILPGMADPKVAEQFVGSSGDAALREGFGAYKLFRKAFEDHVGPMQTCTSILDSGVGWGRIIRFFLKDLEPSKIWGIDPSPEAVDICRRTNRWCRFAQIDFLPPTDFADGTFDLIYMYSVFSHLSEPAQQRWLTEFHRILRPGGLLVATTW